MVEIIAQSRFKDVESVKEDIINLLKILYMVIKTESCENRLACTEYFNDSCTQ